MNKPSRPGEEVDISHYKPSKLIVKGNPPKQNDIYVSDWGLAMGATCRWATTWCKSTCYAQFGNCDWRNPAAMNCLRRRTWVQHQPGEEWYREIMNLPEGAILRLGRSGDIARVDVVRAVCRALRARPDILFMWPTRAWRGLNNPEPWELIERYLPGKVFCSYDPTMRTAPPKGWPVAIVAEPPSYSIPSGFRKCPHYETGINCRSCLACFTSSASRTPLISVSFKLHTCKGALATKSCEGKILKLANSTQYASNLDYRQLGSYCTETDCIAPSSDCFLYDV